MISTVSNNLDNFFTHLSTSRTLGTCIFPTSWKEIFINQDKCSIDLIAIAQLQDSHLVDTPLYVHVKYSEEDQNLLYDPTV